MIDNKDITEYYSGVIDWKFRITDSTCLFPEKFIYIGRSQKIQMNIRYKKGVDETNSPAFFLLKKVDEIS